MDIEFDKLNVALESKVTNIDLESINVNYLMDDICGIPIDTELSTVCKGVAKESCSPMLSLSTLLATHRTSNSFKVYADGNPNIRSRPYVYAVGCNSQFTLLLLDKFSNVACIYIKGSARYVVEIMAGLNISPEDIPYPINTLFMYTVEGVDYIDNRETYNSKVESQIWSKMMDELRSTRELLDSLRDG